MISRRFLTAAVIMTLLAIPIVIAWLMPINMDEFLPYHVLGCWTHPSLEEQPGHFNFCHRYDLTFAGVSLPRRAHLMVGITPSIFYWPVYMVWPHYLSARLTSLISLSLTAVLLASLTELEMLWAFLLVFLNMPLVIQTTADTGPVAFQIVLCLFIPWLWQRRDSLWAAAGIGLLLFLGLEHKPVFIFLIPAIAIVCASLRHTDVAKISKQTLIVFAAMACFSVPYFMARMPSGGTYYHYLLNLLKDPLVDESGDIWPYIANVQNFMHRVIPDGQQYEVHFPELPFSFLSLGFWGVILLWIGLGFGYADKTVRMRIGACLAATLLLCLIFIYVPGGWAGHHVILGMPFLLLAEGHAARALLASGKKKIVLSGIPIFLAVTASCFVTLLQINNEQPYSNMLAVHERINKGGFAQKHVLMFANWGFYYLQHLYGPKDQEIITNIHLPRTIGESQSFASKENRKLAIVGNHNADDMVNDLQGFRKLTMQGDESTRNFWQIWIKSN